MGAQGQSGGGGCGGVCRLEQHPVAEGRLPESRVTPGFSLRRVCVMWCEPGGG